MIFKTNLPLLHSEISMRVDMKGLVYELHKNAACFFEQILEAAPQKTVTIWLFTSHLINYLSKTSKTCWALLKKQGQTHKWHSLMGYYTWTYQHWSTSKNLLSSALCRHWMLFRGHAKSSGQLGWMVRKRERERESRESVCFQLDLMMINWYSCHYLPLPSGFHVYHA